MNLKIQESFLDPAVFTERFINQTNRSIFLTGKAGTGKTTFLKYIKDASHKNVAIVAPTGVAAINAGGVTIHSFFQLPFNLYLPNETNIFGNQATVDKFQLIKNLRFNRDKIELLNEYKISKCCIKKKVKTLNCNSKVIRKSSCLT